MQNLIVFSTLTIDFNIEHDLPFLAILMAELRLLCILLQVPIDCVLRHLAFKSCSGRKDSHHILLLYFYLLWFICYCTLAICLRIHVTKLNWYAELYAQQLDSQQTVVNETVIRSRLFESQKLLLQSSTFYWKLLAFKFRLAEKKLSCLYFGLFVFVPYFSFTHKVQQSIYASFLP